ncbi:ADP-ribosylglycohydrolase family protein [Halomonas sp. M20]|uniref:ADP-ribosylglycohydrolase family protein n=1 Tax=Halomonas sp. M20 TaxID=2763264 RepID=UPI001D0BACA6|nr:ADP-ribosylglycohydrolase family protein [Halomonas sp. M20]
MKNVQRIERSQACLYGGAIGDALGAPLETLDWQTIRKQFGDEGLVTYATAHGGVGRITDDTQMMLFTAEGALRSYVRIQECEVYAPIVVLHHALIRWLVTQGEQPNQAQVDTKIGLISDPRLHARRSPATTSLEALAQARAFGSEARNDSKQCDGLVRVAPIGLFPWGDFLLHHRDRAFSVACELTRCTHGHPCAYLSAGLFAYLVNGMSDNGRPLASLIPAALDFMDSGAWLDFFIELAEEREAVPRSQAHIRFLLETVLDFHRQGMAPSPEGIDSLGRGESAEEALAIAVWCALSAGDYRQGVLWAVNHSGKSDSIGLLAGNLLGLRFGLSDIPVEWVEDLELRDWLYRLGHDLQWLPKVYLGRGYGAHDDELRESYPDN